MEVGTLPEREAHRLQIQGPRDFGVSRELLESQSTQDLLLILDELSSLHLLVHCNVSVLEIRPQEDIDPDDEPVGLVLLQRLVLSFPCECGQGFFDLGYVSREMQQWE